jgi:hypothetical protein
LNIQTQNDAKYLSITNVGNFSDVSGTIAEGNIFAYRDPAIYTALSGQLLEFR